MCIVTLLARLDRVEGLPSHCGCHCVYGGHQIRTAFLSFKDTQDMGTSWSRTDRRAAVSVTLRHRGKLHEVQDMDGMSVSDTDS